ncbi:Oidioi.mRNA.OKI2018_I69.chr1.g482.t1.cds [Oikopleura dioica]|uniref:Oidioi.mRNA.OKI2018_I69.chr1.g482.t1.cds n=1 Tax=Oikopleura dioica TaxID=34765 RepID=A0ABN7SPE0_OIKDI|nr:Oidioi.mRNA.OKI2018_I69.chr1.g482.t1.cds [Oikopleura dioica]
MSLTNVAELRLKTAENRAKIGEKKVKTPVDLFDAKSYCEKQKQKYIASVLGKPEHPSLSNVKMPGQLGIERIRQQMRDSRDPDLQKILFIERKEMESRKIKTEKKEPGLDVQVTTVTPVYHF